MGSVGEFVSIEVLGKQNFPSKEVYLLRMNDNDFVTIILNAFNTMVSPLLLIDIKNYHEYQCTSLQCYFPNSWDSLDVAIGSDSIT